MRRFDDFTIVGVARFRRLINGSSRRSGRRIAVARVCSNRVTSGRSLANRANVSTAAGAENMRIVA